MNAFKTAALSAAILAAAGLSGCKDDDGGRVLLYKPGTYLGRPDAGLSEEQRRALRDRAALQGAGATGSTVPGSGR